MNLLPTSSISRRRLVLLAPQDGEVKPFENVVCDFASHEQLLGSMQRLRGAVYLAEGNLSPADLAPDGRHIQASDAKSWHLLSVSGEASVHACGRILLHDPDVAFSELTLSHSALAQSETWGPALKRSVESEIIGARRRCSRFGEFGGWAIERGLRCTAEAVRMVLAAYALGELLGGVMGVSTVNIRHHSSSILRRFGGCSLTDQGKELPSYYEPAYRSELEILRFDSSQPSPNYRLLAAQCRAHLSEVKVVWAKAMTRAWRTSPTIFYPAVDRIARIAVL